MYQRRPLIDYQEMTDEGRQFVALVLRVSFIAFLLGAIPGLILLTLSATVNQIGRYIPLNTFGALLLLSGTLSAGGAFGLLYSWRRYRADSMLRNGASQRDVAQGDAGIMVLLMAPLGFACLWCLTLLSRGLGSDGDYTPPPGTRPVERWQKEFDAPTVAVWFGPKGEAVAATTRGGVFARDDDGRDLAAPPVESAGPATGDLKTYGGGRRELDVQAGGVRLDASVASPPVIRVLVDGKPVRELKGHSGEILCLALSANGKLAVSGAADGKVIVWDVSRGVETARYQGHPGAVRQVALSYDGKLALSAGGYGEKEVRLWGTVDGIEKKSVPHGEREAPGKLCFSPDGRLALLNFISSCCVLDLETASVRKSYPTSLSFADRIAVSNDGTRAIRGWGSRMLLYELP